MWWQSKHTVLWGQKSDIHWDWYETGSSVCVSTIWDKTGKALTEGTYTPLPLAVSARGDWLWWHKKITLAKSKCGISWWVTEISQSLQALGAPKVALRKVLLCKDRGWRLLSFGRSRTHGKVSGLGNCISNSIPQEFHLEPKIVTKRQKETLATQT